MKRFVNQKVSKLVSDSVNGNQFVTNHLTSLLEIILNTVDCQILRGNLVVICFPGKSGLAGCTFNFLCPRLPNPYRYIRLFMSSLTLFYHIFLKCLTASASIPVHI